MELLSSKLVIWPTLTKFHAKFSNHSKLLSIKFRRFPLIMKSKKSSYQDFQEYAKPSRLLPARGVRLSRDASLLEKAYRSISSSKSESVYKLRLQTSNAYGSGLSDVNSGILLCLIDEDGSSILQRLSSTSVEAGDTWSEENETLCFERGSIDEFAFEGPRLGRIVAVWISVESGQWRIGGINLRVISPLGEKNQEIELLGGTQYEFDLEDVLLGEKGEASMMEFRPRSVTAFSKDESTLFDVNSSPSPASNEESMKEYAYLKRSLLLYDVVLVVAGSATASISIGENAEYAFLIGGLLGFAYLLLLQRSVDELPSPDLIRSDSDGSNISGNSKGSILILASVFALAVLLVRGEYGIKLVPKDLIFGMMGFLMCKVAVVLAAFKPVTPSLRENE